MDRLNPAERSRQMALVRSKNTRPELLVRRLLFALGYRYRLHRTDLPGKPDLVFPSMRKIIFVHGCFWHGHACRLGRIPKSRLAYWTRKIERNRERDKLTLRRLRGMRWKCLVVWECGLPDRGRDQGLEGVAPHPQAFPDIVLGEFGIEVKVVRRSTVESKGCRGNCNAKVLCISSINVLIGSFDQNAGI